MGIIADGIRGEEVDSENDPSEKEERYEKLFMKIARDFVHRDDFERTMRELMQGLLLAMGPTAALIRANYSSNSGAVNKAIEYKAILDAGDDGSKIYKDLIDLED